MSDIDTGGIGATAPGRYGAGSAQLLFAETTIAAAWNVQGDPSRAPFVEEMRRVFDIALPLAPNTTTRGAALSALWLGPKSWLLVAGRASPLVDLPGKRDTLNTVGGALFELSASRVAWTVSGTHAATVLAKSCPLDLHLHAFPAGRCAQSLLGHVNAIVYKPDATPSFTLMVARSYGRDVWQALCVSAARFGYDVAPPGPLR